MAVVGTAEILIKPTFTGFQKETEDGLKGVGSRAGETGGKSLGESLASFGKKGALVAGAAIAAVTGTALVKGFGRLTAIENAQAKLRGLGHDANSVKTIMNDALASVKGTAFGMDQAASTAAGAVAAGVKPGLELQRTLKLVADAATIGGTSMSEMGSIFNKVATSNKIQGEVIAQLGDRGIPIIQLLSKELGKSAEETVKLASEGKINFATFQAAMEDGMGGAALKSGETFSGAMQNTLAAVGRIGANVLSGIFPKIAPALEKVMEWLAPLEEKAKSVGESIGTFLERAMTGVQGLVDLIVKGDFSGKLFEAFGWEEDAPIVGFLLNLRETAISVFNEVKAAITGFVNAWKYNDGEVTSSGLPGFMERLGYAARQAFEFLNEHKDTLIALVPVVLGAVAAFKAAMFIKNLTLAVQVATAVFKAFSATLLANPIFLVIAAIAAIAAILVVLYKNNDTAREWIQKAWAAIQVAIDFAWNRVIKPALEALWNFITNTLIPVMQWLWQNVIVPAFNGIAAVIGWAWNNVIKPVLSALWSFISGVLAPVVQWLWNNVIVPAFNGIVAAIQTAWSFIKPIFQFLVDFVRNIIAPAISWLWDNVVKPVFGFIADHIKNVWNNIIKPVFQALGNFISDTVAPAFQKGVDFIKAAWDTISEAARKPINFIIDTVYNKGIKAMFDKIASAIGSSARLPTIGLLGEAPKGSTSSGSRSRVQERRRGGWTHPGMVLVGEEGPELVDFHTAGRVYTAKQTEQMLMGGGTRPNGDGFGGPLDWISSAKDWVIGNLKSLAQKAIDGALGLIDSAGGGTLGTLAKDAMKNVLDSLLGWAGKKDELEGTVIGTGTAIKGNGKGSQASLMAFARAMQAMGARVTEHPAFGRVGTHSRGSKHYIGQAVDVNYGPGGENATEKAFFDRIVAQGIPQSFGLRTIWRAPGHYNHLHADYDQGGLLKPGMTLVRNATGKPEAILNPQQWRDVSALAARGAGGGPVVQVQHLHVRDEDEMARILTTRMHDAMAVSGMRSALG